MANTTITVPYVSLRLVAARGLWLNTHTPTIAATVGERRNIAGWNGNWPNGLLTNVDEQVAFADGSTVSTNTSGHLVVFNLTSSAITTPDTITNVDMTIRAMVDIALGGGGAGSFDVTLLVGGVGQGTVNVALTGAMANVPASHAGWDQDWTAAQLSGMQVGIVSRQDAPVINEWFIDCIDVDILFTATESVIPAVGTLALSGKIPLADPTTNFKQARPPVGTAVLAGKAPTTDTGIAVDSVQLALAGKPSYLDPVTQQLQPNGWDSGWASGFLANVDEPVAEADGSTISTDQNNQEVLLDLDDVTGITDLDTILEVTMLLRARAFSDVTPVEASVELLISSQSVGEVSPVTLSDGVGSFQNISISSASWNNDWTQAQLNSMQVRITTTQLTFPPDIAYIDALDVIVKYSPQSPYLLTPAAGALALSGTVPTLQDLRVEEPPVGAVALAGKVPLVIRHDEVLPSAAGLVLSKVVGGTFPPPKVVVNFLTQPAIDTLAISTDAPTGLGSHLASPAEVTPDVALSGKVPVADTTGAHTAAPGAERLVLFPQAPLLQTATATAIGPMRRRGVIAGKVPTVVPTSSVIRDPAAATVSIATAAPSIDGPLLIPASVALALTTLTPLRVPSTVLTTPVVSLALAGHMPALGPLEASLVLATYTPTITVNHLPQPATVAITILGQDVIFDNASVSPAVGALNFTGYAPTLSFSTVLISGAPGLISLTVDRALEFIATPTDILIG